MWKRRRGVATFEWCAAGVPYVAALGVFTTPGGTGARGRLHAPGGGREYTAAGRGRIAAEGETRMMGHSHAVSGALVFAAAAPFLPPLLIGRPLQPGEVLVGALLSAGAALLPDLDHHDGTVANLFGPFTRLLCRTVARLSGGHRHATHSLVFVALAGAGTQLGVARWARGFTGGLTFALLLFAVHALRSHASGRCAHSRATTVGLAAIGTAAADTWLPGTGAWLPYAVVLGTLAHVLGDCLTRQGAPLLWPYGRRFEMVLIKRTGNRFETRFLVPVMTAGTLVLVWLATFAPTALTG
ncbi:metal-dependent hydrolase [Kitasatospora sp. NPDC088346]|uniref:metal-dependent hydrolase n=1 Tax=Kitasatospora sp. NPDC088346 TaxID=3364073 RepID=UPI0037F215AD